MQPAFHRRHTVLPVLAGFLMVAAGCHSRKTSLPSAEFRVSAGDSDKARALSDFAMGFLLIASDQQGPEVLDIFSRASERDPGALLPAEASAQLLLQAGRQDEALAHMGRYAQHGVDPVHSHAKLGEYAEFTGDYPRAAGAYGRALQALPADDARRGLVVASLVRVLFHDGADHGALALMKKEGRHPALRDGITSLSQVWMVESLASTNLQRAASLAAVTASLATNRHEAVAARCSEAAALHKLKRPRAAEKALLSALPPYDEAAAPAAISLGNFYARAARTNDIRRLQHRLRNQSGGRALLSALAAAAAWQSLDDATQALAVLESAYPLADRAHFPASPHLYVLYTTLLLTRGAVDQAALLAPRGLAAFPDHPDLLNLFAYTMALKGEALDDAERAVRRALRMKPQNAAYLDTLGWIFYRQGNHANALRRLRQALRLKPSDPVILEHTADAHAALGQLDHAVPLWEKSLEAGAVGWTLNDKLRQFKPQ